MSDAPGGSPRPASVPASAAPTHGDDAAGLILGIIVPCRNEAAVIERKLRNRAHLRWPFSQRPHQIVVVDDGSDDGTFERAQALCAELFARPSGSSRMSVPFLSNAKPVGARALRIAPGAGKAAAIAHGLEALAGEADVIVLTDADVILRPPSMLAFENVFRMRPELGMACGRQEFVASLKDDGSCRGSDDREPVRADEPFDRWSARVRGWESRRGRLFSVHGQLLAWRASLGLRPTPGIAADDLDLMLQVRARGLSVELLPGPTFLEVKPPPGEARRAQQVRRARAYVQIAGRFRAPAGATLFDRLQLLFYRNVHRLSAPWALPLAGLAALALAWWLGGPLALVLAAGAVLLVLVSPLGRGLRALSAMHPVIRAARALETQGSLPDGWDTPRQ